MDGIVFIHITDKSTLAVRVYYDEALELLVDYLIVKDPTIPAPTSQAEALLTDPDSVGEVINLEGDGLLAIVRI
jgi:hypothetical protein